MEILDSSNIGRRDKHLMREGGSSECVKKCLNDCDSGMESFPSSRSSSISVADYYYDDSTEEEADVLQEEEEDDEDDEEEEEGYLCGLSPSPLSEDDMLLNDNGGICTVRDAASGETIYVKPASRITFSTEPIRVCRTYGKDEYEQSQEKLSREHVYEALLEYQIEKRLDEMEVFPVLLDLGPSDGAAPSLGIRIVGVDVLWQSGGSKVNIFVESVVGGSAVSRDDRIRVDDQIVEVNGDSLLCVSKEHAASVFSNCVLCEGSRYVVRFLVARERPRRPTEKGEFEGDDSANSHERNPDTGRGNNGSTPPQKDQCPSKEPEGDGNRGCKNVTSGGQIVGSPKTLLDLPDRILMNISSFLDFASSRNLFQACNLFSINKLTMQSYDAIVNCDNESNSSDCILPEVVKLKKDKSFSLKNLFGKFFPTFMLISIAYFKFRYFKNR